MAAVPPSGAPVRHPMPALCGLHNFNVWIKNQWGLSGSLSSTFGLMVPLGLPNCILGRGIMTTHVSPFFCSKKKKISIFCNLYHDIFEEEKLSSLHYINFTRKFEKKSNMYIPLLERAPSIIFRLRSRDIRTGRRPINLKMSLSS